MGRFLNADGYASTGGIIGTNMFAYCCNNPVMLADPTGEFLIAAVVVGGLLIGGMFLMSGCGSDDYTEPTSKPQTKPSSTKASSNSSAPQGPGLSDFSNKDGSYSLYDNHRGSGKKTNFHEQIGSVKASSPSFSLKNGTASLGSFKAVLMTGGWEWEHFDLSLLDVGSAKVALGYQNNEFNLSAMATIWDPSVTFKFCGINISLTANVGSIGLDFNTGTNKFKLSGGYGWGAGISFSW